MILRAHETDRIAGRRLRTAGLALATLAAIAAPASAQVSLTTVVELAQQHSDAVLLAQSDVRRAEATLSQTTDAFVPSINFGSGLPAFPEIGFTGSLPTIWDGSVESMVFSMPQFAYIRAARVGLKAARLSLNDAQEQAALDASTAYIELDTVDRELMAAHEQEQDAARLVEIEQQRAEAGVDPLSQLLEAQLTAAQLKLKRLHLETRTAALSKQLATLTGLPDGSITPAHCEHSRRSRRFPQTKRRSATPGLDSSRMLARSRQLVAKGDELHSKLVPGSGFRGAVQSQHHVAEQH